MAAAYDPWAPPPDPWAPIEAKRAANIAARDEHRMITRGVQMSYVRHPPTFFHRKELATRAADPSSVGYVSKEKKAAVKDVEMKRDFVLRARSVFKFADFDGSGVLDYNEMHGIALDYDVATVLVAVMDENQDGQVSLEEWLAFMRKVWVEAGPERAKAFMMEAEKNLCTKAFAFHVERVFRLADGDGSRFLDYGEISQMAISIPEAASMMRTLDRNQDGVISEEVARELLPQPAPSPARTLLPSHGSSSPCIPVPSASTGVGPLYGRGLATESRFCSLPSLQVRGDPHHAYVAATVGMQRALQL